MNFEFIISQFIGFVAWILILISYHRKTTNQILIFHMMAALLFCIHYFLLNAYSGVLICCFEFIRDFLYYKFDKDNYIFYFSIFFYIIVGYFLCDKAFSYLPLVASFIDGFILTKNKKIIVLGSIIIYLLWFVYDIFVKSYIGMFSDIVVILSNILILIFNINIFDNGSDKPIVVKH